MNGLESPRLQPWGGCQQLKNRLLLLEDGLQMQGLVNYADEWWHYTFEPETHPDTYFDFVVDPSSLTSLGSAK